MNDKSLMVLAGSLVAAAALTLAGFFYLLSLPVSSPTPYPEPSVTQSDTVNGTLAHAIYVGGLK